MNLEPRINKYIRREEGKGLLRAGEINPPKVRNFLSKYGSTKIENIKLIRTPLSLATKIALNVASFGKLEEKLQELHVDNLFHLSMIINHKILLEKNEVIQLKDTNEPSNLEKTEYLDIPVNNAVTLDELLQNTQMLMKGQYGLYNAETNNCGDFLYNVLKANKLETENSTTFLKQKTIELFHLFPSLTKHITDTVTDIGGIVDKITYGEGLKDT